ncbi:hypothetical protein [Nocardiopsis coralliicola]
MNTTKTGSSTMALGIAVALFLGGLPSCILPAGSGPARGAEDPTASA